MKLVERYLVFSILLFTAITGLLVWAADGEAVRMDTRTARYTAQEIETGAMLFSENCSSCHGNRGEGVGQLGPALSDRELFETRIKELNWAGTLQEFISSTIAMGRVTATRPYYAGDGVIVMAPWAQEAGGPLRLDEIEALTAFVLNWQPSALGTFEPAPLLLPTSEAGSNIEQVKLGEALFQERGCADCHAMNGLSQGNGTAPDLSNIGTIAFERVDGVTAREYIQESILIANAFVVEGFQPGLGCGGVLTSRDFEAVVNFLLSKK